MKCKCTQCNQVCYGEADGFRYPEIVFFQIKEKETIIVCEECSIDWEEDEDGNVVKRTEA